MHSENLKSGKKMKAERADKSLKNHCPVWDQVWAKVCSDCPFDRNDPRPYCSRAEFVENAVHQPTSTHRNPFDTSDIEKIRKVKRAYFRDVVKDFHNS